PRPALLTLFPYTTLFRSSSHIDFHRDLRRGDRFAVVYEGLYHKGELVKVGRVLAAEFVNQGKTYEAVWFDSGEGHGGYYTPEGRSEEHTSELQSRENLVC